MRIQSMTLRLTGVLLLIALFIAPPLDAAPLDDARQLASQGKHAEAVALFDQTLKADPKLAEAYAGKAASLLALNRLDEAQESIERAIELKGTEPGFQMIAGRVLVSKNEIDAARRRYDQAAKQSPKKAGTIYADLAAALTARNDPKLNPQVEAALRSASEADPPHLDSLFNLGQSYVTAGRDEGRTFLQRYLSESAKLPEKDRDARKAQLARQMIRALDILKTTK